LNGKNAQLTGKPLGILIAQDAEEALRDATSASDICAIVDAAADAAADAASRHLKKNSSAASRKQVACADGCSHCCHIRVDSSPLEVLALVHWITSNAPVGEIENLRRRVQAADSPTRGLSERDHSATGVACPILADGLCSAYAARPYDCRGYESYDESVCRHLRGRYDFRQIPQNKPRYNAYLHARDGLIAAARRLGREGYLLELNAALAIAFEQSDAFSRWMDGGRPFAAARIDATN